MINQVIHGDCFEVLKNIPDGSVDAVITDPPYKYLKHKLETDWDERLFFSEILRILKRNNFLVFFGKSESWFRWNYLCLDIGFKLKEEIIWDKVRTSNPLCTMPRSHENIAIYTKGNRALNKIRIDKIDYDSISNPKAIVNDFKRVLSTIKLIDSWENFLLFKEGRLNKSEKTYVSEVTIQGGKKSFDRDSQCFKSHTEGRIMPTVFRCLTDQYNRLHPTQKPVILIQKLIELTTNPGDTILDPFGGSGTTAVACKELGRNYIIIEKEKEYVDIINKRLNNNTEKIVTIEDKYNKEDIEPEYKQMSLF